MKSIEQEEKIKEETALLVDLFLKTNASDIELSNMTGISSSTVGRRLINKEYYDLCFGIKSNEIYEKVRNKRQENLLNGKKIGGQKSALNNVIIKNESGKFMGSAKIDLSLIFNDPDKQWKFLVAVSLVFKLHLDTLSSFLQMNENDIYNAFYNKFPNMKSSLYFLFREDCKNQDIARREFLDYYSELLEAIKKKDINKKNELLNYISDTKAAKIAKTRHSGDPISESDLETILNYQIKYNLMSKTVADMFKIDSKHYSRKVSKYIEDKPKLKSDFDYLSDTFTNRHYKGNIR